jgi:hypothetical protein
MMDAPFLLYPNIPTKPSQVLSSSKKGKNRSIKKQLKENTMNNESKVLPRRAFLAAGVAATASIISIETIASPNSEETKNNAGNTNPQAMVTDDPVTTEASQTLINKKIPSRQNTLGTDYVNVREFSISGTDITDALNAAIYSLTNSGGQILIPHGNWTSKGGHDFIDAISIEGVGYHLQSGYGGTRITHIEGADPYMFRIKGHIRNCSLKNLDINMAGDANSIGLWMTDVNVDSTNIYATSLENVAFNNSDYGIKVESKLIVPESPYDPYPSHFECILNRFERVSFLNCMTSFYCNSINGGYTFDNCFFRMAVGGTALDCEYMGNLALDHCLFFGTYTPIVAHIPPTDGSTILKTKGEYNNICFTDCQDENVQYTYQNHTPTYSHSAPLVFRNCVIQASLKYTASGVVVFDSCKINTTNTTSNTTNINLPDISKGVYVIDTPPSGNSPGAAVKLCMRGQTITFMHTIPGVTLIPTKFASFGHPDSRILYEANNGDLPVINPNPTATSPLTYNIGYASRGIITITAGNSYALIQSKIATANSMIFAQLRTYASNGASIREVEALSGSFKIYLTNVAPTGGLSIAFNIEDHF